MNTRSLISGVLLASAITSTAAVASDEKCGLFKCSQVAGAYLSTDDHDSQSALKRDLAAITVEGVFKEWSSEGAQEPDVAKIAVDFGSGLKGLAGARIEGGLNGKDAVGAFDWITHPQAVAYQAMDPGLIVGHEL